MALHHTDETSNGLTAFGTPEIGYENATSPEQRTDIPPAQRVGLPMYNRDLYEPADTDDSDVVDGEVVDPRHALVDGTDDSGTVAVRKGRNG